MIKFRATSLKFSRDITLVPGDITFDLTLNPPIMAYALKFCAKGLPTLFRLQVYERVGKSVIAVYERNNRALRL